MSCYCKCCYRVKPLSKCTIGLEFKLYLHQDGIKILTFCLENKNIYISTIFDRRRKKI